MLHLDFETYSAADIRRVGGIRYAEDPTTEMLIAGYRIDQGPYSLYLPTLPPAFANMVREALPEYLVYSHMPGDLRNALDNDLIYAHNAGFEKGILKHCMDRDLPSNRFRCSAALAAATALPRALKMVAQALGLDAQKDTEGMRLIRKFSKPVKPTKNQPKTRILPEDDIEDFILFCEYCIQDVKVEEAVCEKLKAFTLSPFEQQVWEIDLDMNFRGVPIDVDLAKDAWSMVLDAKNIQIAECKEEFGFSPTSAPALKKYAEKILGVTLKSMNKESIADMEREGILDNQPELCKAIEYRKSVGKTSTAKIKRMLECISTDRRVRGTSVPYGATTGRWTAALIQTQNLKRPEWWNPELLIPAIRNRNTELINLISGDVIDSISLTVRSMIKAQPGKQFIVSDYAGIEARIISWYAGEEETLQVFRDGGDVYKMMASKIYDKDIDHIIHAERQLGKQAILGAGFGMGAPKFVDTCKNNGVTIDEETSQFVIKMYRESMPGVVSLWYSLNNAVLRVLKTRRPERVVDRFTIFMRGSFLGIRLVTGRVLWYPKARAVMTKAPWGDMILSMEYYSNLGTSGKWGMVTTYGGKLTENVVQATAREIMAKGLRNAVRAGYNPIMLVHDEGVTENDIGFGSLDEFSRLLCKQSSCFDGLPLKAEGYVGQRYKK